jgi:hypothetical protein
MSLNPYDDLSKKTEILKDLIFLNSIGIISDSEFEEIKKRIGNNIRELINLGTSQ